MDASRLPSVLAVIVPDVVEIICQRQGLGEVDATRAFLASRTYAALENEKTKVWHFSPETLYLMFCGEQETGKVAFPQEV